LLLTTRALTSLSRRRLALLPCRALALLSVRRLSTLPALLACRLTGLIALTALSALLTGLISLAALLVCRLVGATTPGTISGREVRTTVVTEPVVRTDLFPAVLAVFHMTIHTSGDYNS
jgi:uncharacterized membrane protein